jgi:hypothetical protein
MVGMTQSSKPIQEILGTGADYTMIDDEQLIIERDWLRKQLDQLTVKPGSSPVAVGQLLSSIEREVQRMTDELLLRTRSRHPA